MERLSIDKKELLIDSGVAWASRHNEAVNNPNCLADVGWIYIMNSVAPKTEKRAEFLSAGLRAIELHFVKECEWTMAEDRILGPDYNFLRMVAGDDVDPELLPSALKRKNYLPDRDGPLWARFQEGTKNSLLWVEAIESMENILNGPSGHIDRAVMLRWFKNQKYRGVC